MQKHTGTIILSPRITEKGANLAEQGIYVFNVGRNANKIEIISAFRTLYQVNPRKVRVVSVPQKKVQTRGTNRKGKTAHGKKAYVYLKKGESIEII